MQGPTTRNKHISIVGVIYDYQNIQSTLADFDDTIIAKVMNFLGIHRNQD
jgi:hypothetical protein